MDRGHRGPGDASGRMQVPAAPQSSDQQRRTFNIYLQLCGGQRGNEHRGEVQGNKEGNMPSPLAPRCGFAFYLSPLQGLLPFS